MYYTTLILFFSHTEDKTIINATLSSKSITEPPVNDFQDFVMDMQKTITSLRKQVRLA